ncbi:DODA-type extradiol aromatic ring-opening family dioxygenase [Thermodesulfobacteriota bacterium]
MKMPVLFISHGPPSILLMEGKTPDFLRSLGHKLTRPKGVICVSAHWETVYPKLTTASRPETIHDFSGPQTLFETAYPAQGDPALAREALKLIKDSGFDAGEDPGRGLDHGAWVPLMMMYPEADIPVVQLSVQTERSPEHHFQLGKALVPFRENGILIMGSGGAVHNLDEVHLYNIDASPPEYVRAFDIWLENTVAEGSEEALIDYIHTAPDPRRSHPFPAEHFLPFFVPLGAASPKSVGKKLHHYFMYGTLSMAAYIWN